MGKSKELSADLRMKIENKTLTLSWVEAGLESQEETQYPSTHKPGINWKLLEHRLQSREFELTMNWEAAESKSTPLNSTDV